MGRSFLLFYWSEFWFIISKLNNMKILKSLSLSVFAVSVLAACNSVPPKKSAEATVVRDCTGTYLRINSNDYLVCNSGVLKDYQEGSKVKANYSKTTYCPEKEGQIVCMMYHENKGMINIHKIE